MGDVTAVLCLRPIRFGGRQYAPGTIDIVPQPVAVRMVATGAFTEARTSGPLRRDKLMRPEGIRTK